MPRQQAKYTYDLEILARRYRLSWESQAIARFAAETSPRAKEIYRTLVIEYELPLNSTKAAR